MERIKKICFSTKVGKAEYAAIIIYVLGLIAISFFHELWFDEAQAWQIARCASYKEILFEVPHYEGHPQFYHLLLSLFAKTGAPYELTMKILNTIFASSAMALLIFKSPFPKIVRCLLPFTYYLGYQYGVIARPYSITMLAVMLISITYKERNEHPWRYILSMTLLLLTTAYGIIIAGGLCVVWTIEIFSELHKNGKLASCFRDKRCYSLLFIFVVALVLAASLIPAEDVHYNAEFINETILQKLISPFTWFLILVLPLEAWSGIMMLSKIEGNAFLTIVVAELFISIAIWYISVSLAKKNKMLLTFFVPYSFLLIFMSCKYVSPHHFGMIGLYHVFIFWIMADKGIEVPEKLKIKELKKNGILTKFFFGTVTVVVCLAPIAYNIVAFGLEVKHFQGESHYNDMIKKNHLEDLKIMAKWEIIYEGNKKDVHSDKRMIPSQHDKVKETFTRVSNTTAIFPYLDHNIFMNFNVDCPDDMYVHWQFDKDVQGVFAQWREKGLPDIILGYVPLDIVYSEEELEGVRYVPFYSKENCRIYKCFNHDVTDIAYIREDLLDDYPQIHPIEVANDYNPK